MIKLLEKQMIEGKEVGGGVKVSLSVFEESVLVAHGKAEFVEENKQPDLIAAENKKGGK